MIVKIIGQSINLSFHEVTGFCLFIFYFLTAPALKSIAQPDTLSFLYVKDLHKYILVRCSLADEKDDFSNEKGSIRGWLGQMAISCPTH